MKYTQITPDIKENYLEELLVFRGIQDLEKYKNPTKECEHNAFKLHNMEAAVKAVHNHIGEKIAMIVDSDCDGFTSAAIIYGYLHNIYPHQEN